MLTDFFGHDGDGDGAWRKPASPMDGTPGVGRGPFVDRGGRWRSSHSLSNTTYIERRRRGRRRPKFTSIVTGVLFQLAIFLPPIAGIVPRAWPPRRRCARRLPDVHARRDIPVDNTRRACRLF
jgi:hypothetical protein